MTQINENFKKQNTAKKQSQKYFFAAFAKRSKQTFICFSIVNRIVV